MVGTDTKVSAVFVGLAIGGWLGTRTLTESTPLQFAVLVGVGVIAPTLVNRWRA